MSPYGKLYLLPVPISEAADNQFIPEYNFNVIRGLHYFIAEDARTARRFLKWFGYPVIADADIALLNEHTRDAELGDLLKPLLEGHNLGLMSDAGCPGIADPGASVVKLAHKKGIEVIALSGPSSIVLSIMASGFNGQSFAFTGYLPIELPQKIRRIKELEQLAARQAQFFIETPYRNVQLLDTLLKTLQPATRLFIGCNITSAEQFVVSKTVTEWLKAPKPELNKVPAVFGIYS